MASTLDGAVAENRKTLGAVDGSDDAPFTRSLYQGLIQASKLANACALAAEDVPGGKDGVRPAGERILGMVRSVITQVGNG